MSESEIVNTNNNSTDEIVTKDPKNESLKRKENEFSEDSNSVLDSANDESNHKKAKHENGADEESNDANDAGGDVEDEEDEEDDEVIPEDYEDEEEGEGADEDDDDDEEDQ
ncbi:hypothetical protein SSS_00956 [Sarcoptes scabiei]|uniref:Uncharacterized protein n=1 Tax=Sarcoptes scabiei TaxID=52283 RepID=A0A834R9Y9_SARSC|nr:hypothetical protein SSS_00956 [Sarcoptes scabiei]